MSGVGGVNRPSNVPKQNGFENSQDIKADWLTRNVQEGKPAKIHAVIKKPIPANAGTLATITIFRENGTVKTSGPSFKAPVINSEIKADWIPSASGIYHYEVRFAGYYGRTQKDAGLNVSRQGAVIRNYHSDGFDR